MDLIMHLFFSLIFFTPPRFIVVVLTAVELFDSITLFTLIPRKKIEKIFTTDRRAELQF